MINCQDNTGRTPIHYAIINHQKYQNYLRLKELYIKGANLNIKDNNGLSPMNNIELIEDHYVKDELKELFVMILH